jgi:hypothetical protein
MESVWGCEWMAGWRSAAVGRVVGPLAAGLARV